MRGTLIGLSLMSFQAAAGTPIESRPSWREGQSWRVRYTVTQPSAAAVPNPPAETRTETWTYKVTKAKTGWLLTMRDAAAKTQERVEASFTRDLVIVKVTRFNPLGEAHEVYNDSDGAGYRSDLPGTPLLDWPDRASGKPQGKESLFEVKKAGYNGFTERFLWKPGKPWWSEAERSYGGTGVKARLLR